MTEGLLYMAKLQGYRDLIVWQKSMTLTKQVYSCTRSFPKEETYGLTSQIRRAAVSIPANIAEGQARNSTGEFLQFLGIARGSLAELETLTTLHFHLTHEGQPLHHIIHFDTLRRRGKR
jgi:four helix bundle protein